MTTPQTGGRTPDEDDRIVTYRAWRARHAVPEAAVAMPAPRRSLWAILSGKTPGKTSGQNLGLAPGWAARMARDFLEGEGRLPTGDAVAPRSGARPASEAVSVPARRRANG